MNRKVSALICSLFLVSVSSFQIASAIAPESPSNMIAITGNEKVYLNWNHSINTNSNLLGYILSVSIDEGETYGEEMAIIAPENGELNNFFVFDDAVNDQSYQFRLRSYNSALEYSEFVYSGIAIPADNSQTDTFAPESPSNLEVTPGNESITLNWDHALNISGDLIGYYVKRSSDGGNSYADERFIGINNEYTFVNLENDKKYDFQVLSTDAVGNESQSAIISSMPREEITTPDIQIGSEIVSTPTFPDVVEGPFREFIEFLEARNIISGYSDGTFRPDKLLNRAEGVTLLLKASDLELDDEIVVQTFYDVDEDYGLAIYIENAYAYSIVDGYEDGSFQAEQNLTRAQFIKVFVEVFGAKLKTVPESFAKFSDVAHDDEYAPWIYSAYKDKITQGFEDGTFQPGELITRAQAAAMLGRFFQEDEIDTITSTIEELQVLSLINTTRGVYELDPYKMDSEISVVARNHADDLTKNILIPTSIGSDGLTPSERLDEAGILYSAVSENAMAASFEDRTITETLQAIHNAIMDQPSNKQNQKANILSTYKNFSSVGIGISINEADKMIYVVVDFIEMDV